MDDTIHLDKLSVSMLSHLDVDVEQLRSQAGISRFDHLEWSWNRSNCNLRVVIVTVHVLTRDEREDEDDICRELGESQKTELEWEDTA